MLQLILSPTHGWEDISYDSAEPKSLMTSGFIPWISLAAATTFIPLIYSNNNEILPLLQDCIVTFLMFFITYFFAGFAFSFYMPRISFGSSGDKRHHTFILYSLGLLALLSIVKHCLPINLAILNFYPLYVILIMWRGVKYLKVTQPGVIPFISLCLLSIMLPLIILQLLFNLIIP